MLEGRCQLGRQYAGVLVVTNGLPKITTPRLSQGETDVSGLAAVIDDREHRQASRALDLGE